MPLPERRRGRPRHKGAPDSKSPTTTTAKPHATVRLRDVERRPPSPSGFGVAKRQSIAWGGVFVQGATA